MRVVCVIPARLASTRFPRKILAKIGSKSMLEHVWLAAKRCPEFSEVYIAVDSDEVAIEAERFGAKWKMTSPECENGTRRLIELVEKYDIDADVLVNWQADEPLVKPQMIKDLLQGIYNPLEEIWTLKKEAFKEEFHNPNVVKVVCDRFGRALYFSRSLIPYDRDQKGALVYKHIGLYAYRKGVLGKIKNLSTTALSLVESLEQLAFLENGLSINVNLTQNETIGVDTPVDLIKVISAMA
jgi:3-deoxy-manno-octulosonate cytidylyltransferase (CMP-KDO synthetase)